MLSWSCLVYVYVSSFWRLLIVELVVLVLLKFQKPTDDARKVVGKMVFNEEAQRWENTAKDEEEDFMAGMVRQSQARLFSVTISNVDNSPEPTYMILHVNV